MRSVGVEISLAMAILLLPSCTSEYNSSSAIPSTPPCAINVVSGVSPPRITCEAEDIVSGSLKTPCSSCSGQHGVPVKHSYENSSIFTVQTSLTGLFRLGVRFVGYADLSFGTNSDPERTVLRFGHRPGAGRYYTPETETLYVRLTTGANQLIISQLGGDSTQIDRFEFTYVDPSEFGDAIPQTVEGESERNRRLGSVAISRVPVIGGLPARTIYDCIRCSGGKYYVAPFDHNSLEMDIETRGTGLCKIRIRAVSGAAVHDLWLSVNGESPIRNIVKRTGYDEKGNDLSTDLVVFVKLRAGTNTLAFSAPGGTPGIDRVDVTPP